MENKKTAFIFNANEFQRVNGDEPIPQGDYVVKIVNAELTTTKQNEEFLKLIWEVVDEKFKGKMIFQNLFINSKNESFRLNQLGKLSQICHVCSKDEIQDLTELFQIPCVAHIVIREKDDFISNEIKRINKHTVAEKTEESENFEDIPF